MLEVEDINEAKKYIEAKGVKTTEITTVPDMVSYFDIKDSEVNGIQIVSTPD
jgi:predicted enzyme related to lactoylglutathione lyase